MDFLNANFFWHLLWILPSIFIALKYASAKRRKSLELLFGSQKNSQEFNTLSNNARLLKNILLFSGLFLLIIAIGRPSWGKKILPFSGSGRDIMLVADVSKSMFATDIQPSRIEHAKWFLRELLNSCEGDRFGVVAFSGDAFLECPLTIDKTTLVQAIEELRPGHIPLGGTNIEKALETALESFDAAEGGHRGIVLISDGDELQGDASSILEKLKTSNIPIFVVGIGNPTQTSPISVKDELGHNSFLRNSQGEIVSSKLNEALLSKIATSSSNGAYMRSSSTDPGLKEIVARIKALAPEKYGKGENTRPIERFQFPLMAGLILLLARLAISERKKILSIILLFIGLYSQPYFSSSAFAQESDEENVKITKNEKTLTTNPTEKTGGKNTPQELYNKGLEKHSKNSLDEAKALYQNAAGSIIADAETREKSFQNIGAIDHKLGREILKTNPQKALESFYAAEKMYKEAMRGNIASPDISENQQLLLNDITEAKKIIEEQKKQQENKDKARKDLEKAAEKNKKAQNNPGDKKEKDEAEKQTSKANESMDEHLNQTPDENKPEKEKAEKAKSEIQKAMQEQKNNDLKKAQEHLDKAIEEFSKNEEKDDKTQREKNEKQNKDDKEKKTEQSEGQKKEKDKREIDPDQAKSILDLMAQDENKLRDEIQKNRQDKKLKNVDQDW
jgi:Ca-activated chloride channel family protein